MRYNGWHNRATWNAALWLQNDEWCYMSGRALCEKSNARTLPEAAAAIRDYCRQIWPTGSTPDGFPLASIPKAGWREIARSFRKD